MLINFGPDVTRGYDFAPRIRRFIELYTVREAAPVPFGGRQDAMEALDVWLSDPAAEPRLLLVAPAGRGKSALLVRWLERLRHGPSQADLDIAFVPISIRFETSRPAIFWEALARQLAALAGEQISAPAGDAAMFYADHFGRLLDMRASEPDTRRLLVVVDGIDEATAPGFRVEALPAILPAKVRIVFSARLLAGDADWHGWRDRLDWSTGTRVRSLDLPRLDLEGVADVLVRLGAPADDLAQDGTVVRELLRLTEGEPLLVGLYADQLWDAAGRLPVGARVGRGDLVSMRPGLAGFFDRWLAQHDEQLRGSGREPDVAVTEGILAIMAHALGPLDEGLLLAMARSLLGGGASISERIVRELGRLVTGDGSAASGYVLTHPALTVHLKELRLRAEGKRVHALFVSLARQPGTNGVDFSEAPYLVQHLAEHMRLAGCPARDFTILLTAARRRAWASEGSGDQGFAADVQAALVAFSALSAREAVDLWFHCSLVLSTIRSKNGSAPPALITACLHASVMSKREAISRAQATPSQRARLEVLLNVLEICGHDDEVAEMALGLAAAIGWRTERAEAFARLTRVLPSNAITQMIETAATFINEEVRSDAFAALARGLPADVAARAIGKAVQAANRTISAWTHADAIKALVQTLRPDTARQVTEAAIEAAAAINDIRERSAATAALTRVMPSDVAATAIREAFNAAPLVENLRINIADCFAKLARLLPPDTAVRALAIVFSAPGRNPREWPDAELLTGLLPAVPSALMPHMVEALFVTGSSWERAQTLAALAPALPAKTLARAIAVTATIAAAPARADVYAALARSVRAEAAENILDAIGTLSDKWHRLEALSAFLPNSPEVLGPPALDATTHLDDDPARAQALVRIACNLPRALLSRALDIGADIEDESARADALQGLIPVLPANLLPRCLRAIAGIELGRYRAAALARFATVLPSGLAQSALDLAIAIPEELYRAKALLALGPAMPADLLGSVLAATSAISDERSRAEILVALIPTMPPVETESVLRQVLESLAAVDDYEDRIKLSAELAVRLTTALHPLTVDISRVFGDDVLPSAIRAVSEINFHDDHAKTREVLVERLRSLCAADQTPAAPPTDLARELQVAMADDREWRRASDIVRLAPQLSAELLQVALKATLSMDGSWPITNVLRALAPQLAPDLFPSVLEAISGIGDAQIRADALGTLAPWLPPALLPSALEAASAIRDGLARAGTLGNFARLLSPTDAKPALDDALEAATGCQTPEDVASALVTLAPTMPDVVLPRAVAAVTALKGGEARIEILGALAPLLPDELLAQVLDHALSPHGADALAVLAPFLPPNMLPRALDAAITMDPVNRGSVLCALACRLARDDARDVPFDPVDALDLVMDVRDDADRAAVLGALAQLMRPEDAAPTFDAAVNIAISLVDWLSSKALAALVPNLPEALLPLALDAAVAIRSDDSCCAQALTALAPVLPKALLPRVLERAREMGRWHSARAAVLVALAPVLPIDLLISSAADAATTDNIVGRAQAIAAIGSRLPRDSAIPLFRETINAVATAPSQRDRAGAIAALAPVLPTDLLADALRSAERIDDDMDRATALSALIRAMLATEPAMLTVLANTGKDQQARVNDALLGFANAIARLHRGHALNLLSGLTSEIELLGGDTAVKGICTAICTTARWQP